MPSDRTEATDSVETALARATEALSWYRDTSGAERADFLVAIADELESVSEQLVTIARRETGLGEDRLSGEVAQTRVNLGLLADWVREDRDRRPVHDPADPGFPRGARPDIRRTLVPVGVALNFAASNFPFAFSVAGVDSAGALAAGCPVVVKAHPGHPATSRASADAVRRAARRVFDRDDCPLQLIEGNEEGVRALLNPRIAVATFTGSLAGGRHLAGLAATRPAPIPFYGELGSVNPVVVTADAARERGAELGRGFVDEVAFSGGQVCVKPGLLLVPRDHGLDEAIARRAQEVPEHRLLYPSLGAQYLERRAAVLGVSGARPLAEGTVRTDEDGHVWATPTIVTVPFETARTQASTIAEEVFGPSSIVVECDDVERALVSLPEWVPGSLTATVHLGGAERDALQSDCRDGIAGAVRALRHIAGRVIVDEWPGAVYTTPAQHHGGPFPATTLDTAAATSVGQLGLGRFQRAVAWQNAPEAFF
ncbi:aldehyde dehydrogenase family protein [Microbacterium sp. ET2]|uniref:aldehyde dehydrogenase family protein n=1 Tax=Microbacterium albipurpureum TaxID=3050384 RepID=UPI00259CF4CF|nr:aldehyde dehydrogenase family protein [Microbacterium sp. ET2 (Ac-2212)]WJL96745.1 aldehyde dehydrogenase family protein [Microbacterium sp. ET2 (Ac-2212)]